MRDLLIALIIFGSIPFIFKRPFVGALMWCWISYMVPHRLGWGFITEFPVAMLIGSCFLFAYLVSKEPKRLPVTPPVILLILMLLWICITTLIAPSDPYKTEQFVKIMKIQLAGFVILSMLNTQKRIELALWVIALSIGFYGAKGGVFTIISGGSSRVWGPPGGFFEGNNELGLTLLINLPILIYLYSQTQRKLLRYALLAIGALSLFSILGTHSRGALVAAICVGMFLWLKSPKKLNITLALLILIPIALAVMPEHWYERMDTIIQSKQEDYDGSVQGRFNAWSMAFHLASNQFFGGGLAATNKTNFALYAPNPNMLQDSHSIYFQMLGQHGYIGLILFLALGLSTWQTANRIIRLSNKREQLQWAAQLARMLQCSLIAYATGGAFLGLAYFDLPYHILITLVATLALVEQQQPNRQTIKQKLKGGLYDKHSQ